MEKIKRKPKIEELNSLLKVISQVVELSESAWNDFSRLFSYQKIKRGDFFTKEGKTAKDIGFVLKGLFRIYYLSEEGYEYNKIFITENEFVASLTALLTDSASKINIQALHDSAILMADYHEIVKLYDKHQKVERLARKLIEQKFIVKELREIQLVTENATQRYLGFMKEYPDILKTIPQYHIASFLGITPVQLSRIKKSVQ